MLEYKFIRIDISKWNNEPKEDYHNIIKEEAKGGWELVQIFAPSLATAGFSKYIEIIMKKEV
ncbi:uncharacterized protein DUF4177 [Lachnotalea glycerini]|uniref:DUF4177 domain-containing protein n=1 Tax=Lachnotalea glycerini TaxID=1763509 RepID=A0A255K5Z5_9FIRM|nr:DUF4177 domain-containing protein [Lachnotalea glycerini]OYO59672.1 hypothetical protein CG709_18105 [Lachnotalea glycerini]PXV93725.1 uncharacterized protein DUF4177 [Lachnotalea glycerini]RDY32667.1 DUF4177 domain-containing protein [Lachnotalea glycerini]